MHLMIQWKNVQERNLNAAQCLCGRTGSMSARCVFECFTDNWVLWEWPINTEQFSNIRKKIQAWVFNTLAEELHGVGVSCFGLTSSCGEGTEEDLKHLGDDYLVEWHNYVCWLQQDSQSEIGPSTWWSLLLFCGPRTWSLWFLTWIVDCDITVQLLQLAHLLLPILTPILVQWEVWQQQQQQQLQWLVTAHAEVTRCRLAEWCRGQGVGSNQREGERERESAWAVERGRRGGRGRAETWLWLTGNWQSGWTLRIETGT